MIIYLSAICIRLLLFWGYHSTDFEVHRNWKAITYSLPINEWYYESTSEWTLDYPPFFSYFEYMLSLGAAKVDPLMLKISPEAYESEKTIFYMRSTVILSELILFFSLYLFKDPIISGLILLNPGLIILDHIHFQYNGMMLGLVFICIYLVNKEKFLLAAIVYASLLMLKHIYLYYAPALLFFYLKHYCVGEKSVVVRRVLMCGVCVMGVIILGFLPFSQHLLAIKSRLFPWGRGLTHSYWAPNFWSLYNTLDVILNFFINKQLKTEYTQGFVKICNHSVLPNIEPLYTFIIIIISLFFLAKFVAKSNKDMFCEVLCLSGLIFFMFGWHVHEKAIMTISLPMILLYSKYPKTVFLLNFFAIFSLFPLIFQPPEQGFILFSLISYTAVLADILKMQKSFNWYFFCSIPTYLIYMFFNTLKGSETFIPLLTISVYNAIGIIWSTYEYLQAHSLQKIKKI